LIISSWFYTKSLTLSMGAAAVLETPAATPDSIKLSKNPNFLSDILILISKILISNLELMGSWYV